MPKEMDGTGSAIAEPAKGSDSLSGGAVQLMRITLQSAGVVYSQLTDAEVPQAYRRFAEKRDAAAAEARGRAEAERDQRYRFALVTRMRDDLDRAKIDHAGMTDEQVQQRHAAIVDDLTERQNRQRAERERDIAARRARERAESLFRAARCPERHTYNLDGIDPDRCPRWVAVRDRLYIRSQQAGGCLFGLLGVRGTGKTEMAVSLIHLSTAVGLSARYAKASDIFREIRATYTQQPRDGRHVDTEADVFARYAAYDVLVIDEVHQRADTPAEANALTSLIDRRYDGRLVTVLIANQTKQEFAAGIGDSIVSRMYEDGDAGGGPIVCDWPSFRRPGAERSAADLAPRVPVAGRSTAPRREPAA